MIDANTAALREYERRQEAAEKRYEQFLEEVQDKVLPLWEEAKELFESLADDYDIDANFCEEMRSL